MTKYMCGLNEVQKGDFLEPEGNGCLWNDSTIETVKLDGHWYTLYGWNGQDYGHCWEVDGPDGYEVIDQNKEYTLIPVYEAGDDENDYSVVGYRIG